MSFSSNLKDWIKVEKSRDAASIRAIITGKPLNGYVGWTGYGNLGDEAVYEAAKVLMPTITPFRVSRRIDSISKMLGRPLPLKSFYLGGGTLINQSIFWLEQSEYAVAHKVPSFCIGSGVASKDFWQHHSDIHTANNLDRWTKVLNEFVFVGVRGPLSQEKLANVGIKSKIVGDAAFALAPDTVAARNHDGKIVGLNISYGTDGAMWGDPQDFMNAIEKSARELVAEGYEVRLLPIWKPDVAVSQQIVNAVNSSKCTLVNAFASLDDYLKAVGQCNYFVGEKLHATIFSCMLRIPSIMLEYRPKCRDFMESIDMGQYSLRTDEIHDGLIVAKIQDLYDNYNHIAKVLDQKTLHYKLQQNKAIEVVKAKLPV